MKAPKSIGIIAVLVAILFLISAVGTIQAGFAQSGGAYSAPSVTYFTARWGCGVRINLTCGLGYEHRLTPTNGKGFDLNIPGDFATSQQIEENSSVYDALTNYNGQAGLELGFVDYNIGTISQINNITISGYGNYTVKLWFDVTGSGYGVWNSSNQRISMANDSYAIVQTDRRTGPQFIGPDTRLQLTFVDGDKCTNSNFNCIYTLGTLKSLWGGLGVDPEVAFLVVLDSQQTGEISFMINSVTFNLS